jgi:hypothetical protein
LELVHRFLGSTCHDALRQSFRDHGVQYFPPRAGRLLVGPAVPSVPRGPGTD